MSLQNLVISLFEILLDKQKTVKKNYLLIFRHHFQILSKKLLINNEIMVLLRTTVRFTSYWNLRCFNAKN